MKIVLYSVALIMILITLFGCFSSYASLLFAGGSDVLMELVQGNLRLQILFVVLFCGSVIITKWRDGYKRYLFLGLLFLLWFLSGRTISLFPDGKIRTGWFYFKTWDTNICKEEKDCEKVFYYETHVKKLPLWFLRVTNKDTNAVIFVGPVVWSETLSLFKKRFHEFGENESRI